MTNYSFVIPHHNSPTLLNRCLDSIPQREDIEIIVVDDNSDADKKPQEDRPDVKLKMRYLCGRILKKIITKYIFFFVLLSMIK